MYATNVPNHLNGPSHFDGTIEAGRRSHGGKNDANHHYVPADQAQNGGVRVFKSLHTTK